MRMVLRGIGRALPAGSVMLLLAACGSTPAPTTAGAVAVTAERADGDTLPMSSAIVRGLVVDSANRPVAGANVECSSDAQCKLFTDVSAQDGIDQGVKTNANGTYVMIVSHAGTSGFLLNASARGFALVWQDVRMPGPSCSWDQPGCSLTVNFTLTSAE